MTVSDRKGDAASFSDEEVMAYVDGQLDAATAARLARALVADEDLATRVEVFERSAQVARKGLEPVLEAPLPDHLVAAARNVEAALTRSVRKGEAPRVQRIRVPSWLLPGLTAVALGLGIFLLASPPRQGGDASGPYILASANTLPAACPVGDLAGVLEYQASGKVVDTGAGCTMAVVATLVVDEGWCREIQLKAGEATVGGLVCRQPSGGWQVRSLEPVEAGSTYATASSVIDKVLTPDEEAALIQKRWRN